MDLLGSTRAVVEGAAVVESYDYDSWGLLLPGRTLGSGTTAGFAGKERDAESGLDYFGARLYMAALGRWTTVDPPATRFQVGVRIITSPITRWGSGIRMGFLQNAATSRTWLWPMSVVMQKLRMKQWWKS
jgi:RHS repeat-associated protein